MRSRDVEVVIRRRIVTGAFPAGGRLPTRNQMMEEFRCSSVTLQRAIDRLIRWGFIQTNGSAGTFVKADAPHLTRFGVVLPRRPSRNAVWSLFLTALTKVAGQIERESDLVLPLFYDAPTPRHDTDYQELLQNVLEDRLSGLIFVTMPFPFLHTPVLDKAGIPRVAIATPLDQIKAIMPHVYVDFPAFICRALDCAAERGGRRVALMSTFGKTDFEDDFCAEVARRGLMTRPYWIHPISIELPRAAMRTAHLLMRLPRGDRPDVLIVADDNLVEPVTEGLAVAGVRVPEDLLVVAHCNYPLLPKAAVPVTWLGFDTRAILEHCIEDLRKQREGMQAAAYWEAPALFAHELEHKPCAGRAVMEVSGR